MIRSINDPEHPHSLETLMVVSQKQIRIKGSLVEVEFTPTVPHCGMATIIGEAPSSWRQTLSDTNQFTQGYASEYDYCAVSLSDSRWI